MSSVHYKFKSSLDYDTLTFDGLSITLGELKKAIAAKKLGKNTDFDLQITNAQTKEVYVNDDDMIPKNASVIVSRIPVGKPWETNTKGVCNISLRYFKTEYMSLEKLTKTANLASANASEDDKIMAMMRQSTKDYDTSTYMKPRFPTGPPPMGYVCFKCNKPGHLIQNCTAKTEMPVAPEPKLRRATGIPQSFLTPLSVPGSRLPGAMITPSGHIAVATLDARAYMEGKKEKPPFVKSTSPERRLSDEHKIPGELLCPLCKDMVTDAVVIPCCGNSYCDECIRNALLSTEDHVCPSCGDSGVSPDNLVPNKFLRTAVKNFMNETGYHKASKTLAANNAAGLPHHQPSPPPQQRTAPTSVVSEPPAQVILGSSPAQEAQSSPYSQDGISSPSQGVRDTTYQTRGRGRGRGEGYQHQQQPYQQTDRPPGKQQYHNKNPERGITTTNLAAIPIEDSNSIYQSPQQPEAHPTVTPAAPVQLHPHPPTHPPPGMPPQVTVPPPAVSRQPVVMPPVAGGHHLQSHPIHQPVNLRPLPQQPPGRLPPPPMPMSGPPPRLLPPPSHITNPQVAPPPQLRPMPPTRPPPGYNAPPPQQQYRGPPPPGMGGPPRMHQPPPPGIGGPPQMNRLPIPPMTRPPPGYTGPPPAGGPPGGPVGGPPPPGLLGGPRSRPLTKEEFYRAKQKILEEEMNKTKAVFDKKKRSDPIDDFARELEMRKKPCYRSKTRSRSSSYGRRTPPSRDRSRSFTPRRWSRSRSRSYRRSWSRSRSFSRSRSRSRRRSPIRRRSYSRSRSRSRGRRRSTSYRSWSRSPRRRSQSPRGRRRPPPRRRTRSRSPYSKRRSPVPRSRRYSPYSKENDRYASSKPKKKSPAPFTVSQDEYEMFEKYIQYAESHDPKWIEWYREYYDCLYGENRSGKTSEAVESKYPGAPKGFFPDDKRPDSANQPPKGRDREKKTDKSRDKQDRAEKGKSDRREEKKGRSEKDRRDKTEKEKLKAGKKLEKEKLKVAKKVEKERAKKEEKERQKREKRLGSSSSDYVNKENKDRKKTLMESELSEDEKKTKSPLVEKDADNERSIPVIETRTINVVHGAMNTEEPVPQREGAMNDMPYNHDQNYRCLTTIPIQLEEDIVVINSDSSVTVKGENNAAVQEVTEISPESVKDKTAVIDVEVFDDAKEHKEEKVESSRIETVIEINNGHGLLNDEVQDRKAEKDFVKEESHKVEDTDDKVRAKMQAKSDDENEGDKREERRKLSQEEDDVNVQKESRQAKRHSQEKERQKVKQREDKTKAQAKQDKRPRKSVSESESSSSSEESSTDSEDEQEVKRMKKIKAAERIKGEKEERRRKEEKIREKESVARKNERKQDRERDRRDKQDSKRCKVDTKSASRRDESDSDLSSDSLLSDSESDHYERFTKPLVVEKTVLPPKVGKRSEPPVPPPPRDSRKRYDEVDTHKEKYRESERTKGKKAPPPQRSRKTERTNKDYAADKKNKKQAAAKERKRYDSSSSSSRSPVKKKLKGKVSSSSDSRKKTRRELSPEPAPPGVDEPVRRKKKIRDDSHDSELSSSDDDSKSRSTRPPPSKWDNYESPLSTSPMRSKRDDHKPKSLPRSVIESADLAIRSKPRKVMLASKVTSPPPPAKSSGGRRVFVDDKSISAHESDKRHDERKVVQSSRNVKVTVQTDKTRSRSPDSRSHKLASDRDSGRKSVKDRLGIRGSVESKDGSSSRRHNSWSSEKDARHSSERKRQRSESEESDRGRKKRDGSKHSKERSGKTTSEHKDSAKSASSKKSEAKSSSSKMLERKVSQLDEAGFEPDYDESNSESEVDSEPDLSSDGDDDSVMSSSSSASSSPDRKRTAAKKRKHSERDSSSPTSSKRKKAKKASKHKKVKKHKKHKKEHKKHKHKHEKKDKKKDKR